MMVMCPKCFEIFPELWVVPCPKCRTKTFATDLAIVESVEKLIKLRFAVSYSCCYTEDEDVGKTTKIRIEFAENYPLALFQDLPYDWMVYEDVDVASETYKRFTALGCAYWHQLGECDDDTVNFDKRVIVANLEEWLDEDFA